MSSKKLIAISLVTIMCSLIVCNNCKATDEEVENTMYAFATLTNAVKYEKTIEKYTKDKKFKWHPVSDNDFGSRDAEYGEKWQLGKSNDTSSFKYYFDDNSGYLFQLYRKSNKMLLVTWEGRVPIGFEEYNN